MVDLLRKAFAIKGVHKNRIYGEFINNEMTQFLTNQESYINF